MLESRIKWTKHWVQIDSVAQMLGRQEAWRIDRKWRLIETGEENVSPWKIDILSKLYTEASELLYFPADW